MRKQQLGNPAIAALVLMEVFLWVLFPPPNAGVPDYALQTVGELVGSAALILMACSLVLAARLRVLEPYFGGLDRMYRSHRIAAVTALTLLLAHAFITPHLIDVKHLGTPLGSLALLGFLGLAALSLAPRLVPLLATSSERRQVLHALNGVLFMVSLAHAVLVHPLLNHSAILLWYYLAISFAGLAAYLYHSVLARFIRTTYPYAVARVRALNATMIEVTLMPKRRHLAFEAGQFLYVRFEGDRTLRQSHPFTVSSAPQEPEIRLAIKASGEYSRHLCTVLKAGAAAEVEGSYGMFRYSTGSRRQIWVAGGIGITPFLSWMRDFTGPVANDIDFYYVVHAQEDAVYLDELRTIARQQPRLRIHLWCSATAGALTASRIAGSSRGSESADIFLCGPSGMIGAFTSQFRQLGIPAARLHYEEFTFLH